MDKVKIRQLARLVAIGTDVEHISEKLRVSQRTLRRWRREQVFQDELQQLNRRNSTEVGILVSQLQSTALKWAICYFDRVEAKDSIKAQILTKLLDRQPTSVNERQSNDSQNSEALRECFNLIDSLANQKR